MTIPKQIGKLSLFEFVQLAVIVGGFIWFAAFLRADANYRAVEQANTEARLQKIDNFGSFKMQSHEATDDQRVVAITKRIEATEKRVDADHDVLIRVDENIKALLARIPQK